MEAMLSKEIQAGLDAARNESLRKASRLRLEVGGIVYPVLRMWKTGFAVTASDAPTLRGLVDLYDGSVHLFQCLVVASELETDEMRYEFKRATAVASAAALDFVRSGTAPAGLITDNRSALSL
ncbi:hypothetical protein Z946_1185 [Sulfitobacter noctilucicola]|uniref:Uncharacterized protein n=1 Tax=Sulfitobacter noctilucicola TaxID=1342301 RepID=A0A7W6Q328_9RHOB|nr:hypothetical protein [Sulfitobacter noctilucicola]KIN62328.1 hypothetical protein Z946_1185 [Sulfitobacter noctilucicola]MBB4173138.1 hypothetical protein [Sulfitobacter noctilucicola]